MRRTLYQRQLALAAVAGLAVVAVLAASALRHPASTGLPAAVGAYSALAGPSRRGGLAASSDCHVRLLPTTEGIEDPVLPCGIRLYVSYRGRTVLASVIGHGPVPGGREFDLTPALASSLRLSAVRRVSWSYAAEGG